ncbi:MAG TPA: hypothetical protein VG389_06980 [Myxococcota bacterium]|nr:hypothetical protein [Myxococcota bacterium]
MRRGRPSAVRLACALVASASLAAAPARALAGTAASDVVATRPDVMLFLSAGAGAPVSGTELADAIRIQLADLGFVLEERSAPPTGTLAEQLRAVAALLVATRARLALWHAVEMAPGGGAEVVLYVATPRGEATLVKIVRVAVASDPAMYRTLALKVRALVRGALLLEGGAPFPETLTAPRLAPPRAVPVAPAATRLPVASLGVGWAIAALHDVRGWRHGLAARAALDLAGPLEVFAAVTAYSTLHAAAARGPAALRETALVAGLRARWRVGLLEAGVALRAGVRLLSVEALVPGTTEAARVLRAPAALGLALDVGLRPLPRLYLGAALGADAVATRERFTLGGEQVFDSGRAAAGALLFLSVSIP